MTDGTSISTTDAGFVVVANRLPMDLEPLPDGTPRWKSSPGGLVTALEPFLRSRRGAWIGWPGVSDAEAEPLTDGDITLHPVTLSDADVTNYYEGFSHATLWPLYHDAVAPPAFHRHWWEAYVEVNERFAAAAAKIAGEAATVWVQDYQLQLMPRRLRELRPDLQIGFFLHIPFPPVELFMQLPWRTELIRGLLGADLVGFQLPGGAQNFLFLARKLAGVSATKGAVGVRTRPGQVDVGDRTVQVGAFPISIDSTALDKLARSKPVRRGDPRRAGQPGDGPARGGPAGLHQGHRRSAARPVGALRAGPNLGRRRRHGTAGHPVTRAGGALPVRNSVITLLRTGSAPPARVTGWPAVP